MNEEMTMQTQLFQQARRARRRDRRGMTLIEIMVVVTIIGVMTAGVGIAVINSLHDAKVKQTYTDMAAIQNGLKLYLTKKGKYPDTGTGLKALLDQGILDKPPLDPWGNEYVYMNEAGKPVITSYGADGAPGGEGKDRDLSTKDAPGKE